jgi:hypothetical protein
LKAGRLAKNVIDDSCPRLRGADRAKIIATVHLISDALPFGALWYGEPDAIVNAIAYVKFIAVHIML